MKKGLTEIVFILDRSGLEADTSGIFNSLICDVIYDRVPMDKVAKLTDGCLRRYGVAGCCRWCYSP